MTYPVSMSRFHSRPCPTRHEIYMAMAKHEASKANCPKKSVACLLLNRHSKSISTGYNLRPYPLVCDCKDKPQGSNTCKATHAEIMALLNNKYNEDIMACYITLSPCYSCIKALLATTCHEIYFEEYCGDDKAKELWLEAGRKWVQL